MTHDMPPTGRPQDGTPEQALGASPGDLHEGSHEQSPGRPRVRVGIDLRALQIGHQFRGIGAVARAIISELDARLDPSSELVGFADPVTDEITQMFDGLITSGRPHPVVEVTGSAPSRIAKVRNVCDPDFEATVIANADVLVQFDHLLGVPEAFPSVIIVFDQIPLELGDRYPVSYKPTYAGARRAGIGRLTALNKAAARWRHERQLAAALERADSVVVISEHTRTTTLEFAEAQHVGGVAAKTFVAHLGLATEAPDDAAAPDVMEQDLIDGYGLASTPFVFFMGGTDDRRRIQDLVAAFNRVRGRGRDLKLVLAGYDFASIEGVISPATRAALVSSSYADDIHLVGYVGDAMRHWLYHHAAAYVFPSIAEGFGMPVLEANSLGCPVIAYDNPAVAEVAGPNTFLVEPHWKRLTDGIETILDRSEAERGELADAGRAWAARFDWDPMGTAVTDAIHRATRLR